MAVCAENGAGLGGIRESQGIFMLTVGKIIFCTIDEIGTLSEPDRQAEYAVFSDNIYTLTVRVPAKASPREIRKIVRVRLAGESGLIPSISSYSYNISNGTVQAHYVDGGVSRRGAAWKSCTVAFGSMYLKHYPTKSVSDDADGLLYVINLKDPVGFVALVFVAEGRELLYRLVAPGNREELVREVHSTAAQAQRDYRQYRLAVAGVGFEGESFDLPGDIPFGEIHDFGDIRMKSCEYIRTQKTIPYKTILLLTLMATGLFFWGNAGIGLYSYIRNYSIKKDVILKISQNESAIYRARQNNENYKEYLPFLDRSLFLKLLHDMETVTAEYPVTVVRISADKSQYTIELRVWGTTPDAVEENIAFCRPRILASGATWTEKGSAREHDGWFYRAIELEGDLNAYQELAETGNLFGAKPESMADNSGCCSVCHGRMVVERIPGWSECRYSAGHQEKSGANRECGEKVARVPSIAIRSLLEAVSPAVAWGADGPGRSELELAAAKHSRQGGAGDRRGGNGLGERNASEFQGGGVVPGKEDRSGAERSVPGTAPGKHPDRLADGGDRGIFEAGPGARPEKIMALEQERLRNKLNSLENEVKILKKNQKKEEEAGIVYNPPGLMLVSMSPSQVVLKGQDNYRYFLKKNDSITYGQKLFVLTEVQLGKQVKLVSKTPGQKTEVVVLLMTNRQRFGADSPLEMLPKAPEPPPLNVSSGAPDKVVADAIKKLAETHPVPEAKK